MADPREIAHEHTQDCLGDFPGGFHTSKCKMAQEAIVKLIAAETERCAKVAENHWAGEVGNKYMPSVAAAIRNQP